MIARHVCKGEAHPESRVAVDYLCLSLENALIPENSQRDESALGKRIQRVDVATAKAHFRGRPESSVPELNSVTSAEATRRAAPDSAPFRGLKGLVSLNHR